MSSPVEPGPAGATSVPSTPKSEDLVIEGTRIPLPRWARFLIGILAIAGAAVPIVSFYTNSISPKNQAASFVAAAQSATPTPPVDTPGVKVTDVDLHYQESLKHMEETPRSEKVILDSPDLGTLRVRFFISDRCLQVIRRGPGQHPQITSHFILAAKMEDKAPGKIAQAEPVDSIVDQGWLESQMEPASYQLAGSFEPPREATSSAPNCLNPHGGPFRWWNGEQRGCWLQVWRLFGDNCRHYQWFNTCTGYWDSLPNGAPQVYWTNCVH